MMYRNVPLYIVTEKDGKPHIDRTPLLQERATHIELDTNKPFKLNAGTSGVCKSLFMIQMPIHHPDVNLQDRVLYTPERLALIAAEAAKENSVFSLEDRMGLVQDAMALSKAGLAKVSSALTLVDTWKNEKECTNLFPLGFLFASGLTWCTRSCLGKHFGKPQSSFIYLVGAPGCY